MVIFHFQGADWTVLETKIKNSCRLNSTDCLEEVIWRANLFKTLPLVPASRSVCQTRNWIGAELNALLSIQVHLILLSGLRETNTLLCPTSSWYKRLSTINRGARRWLKGPGPTIHLQDSKGQLYLQTFVHFSMEAKAGAELSFDHNKQIGPVEND